MTVLVGDCREVMADMAANSVDTIITDPPYGLEFMGKEWDHGIPGRHFWELALRVAKPGAILMAFGGTRTWHRLACAIEDAGWEIRDTLMWLYGNGFPKSHDISKAIDKAAGVEREVVGIKHGTTAAPETGRHDMPGKATGVPQVDCDVPITAPATALAAKWDGWGTALKPAWEPIILAMKPLDGTFAHNAETWGVAGLNIDGGRIGVADGHGGGSMATSGFVSGYAHDGFVASDQGRWPANLLLSEDTAAMLDEMSGELHSNSGNLKQYNGQTGNCYNGGWAQRSDRGRTDTGGASRFFYVAKASRREREAGCEGMEVQRVGHSAYGEFAGTPEHGTNQTSTKTRNHHPTVKPIALMRYLVKLTATPTGGVVLDPFMGSGSTGCACALEGREFIGIEQEPEYAEIAERRIAYWETLHDPLPRR